MTRTRHQTGLDAEAMCRFLLRLKFYRILAVRYKTPVGEIDIVAVRGKILVAIEVKARATREAALESVGAQQRARISRALEGFALRHPRFAGYDMRFDVMCAVPGRWPLHITNAWRVE